MFEIGNTIAAFSEGRTERLTRLSKARLRSWSRQGLVLSGQYVMPVELVGVVADTQRAIEAMARRSDAEVGHVGGARGIAGSAAVLAGTRIRVDSIRRLHEDGYAPERIIAEYPDLTVTDIAAALSHGQAAARSQTRRV